MGNFNRTCIVEEKEHDLEHDLDGDSNGDVFHTPPQSLNQLTNGNEYEDAILVGGPHLPLTPDHAKLMLDLHYNICNQSMLLGITWDGSPFSKAPFKL